MKYWIRTLLVVLIVLAVGTVGCFANGASEEVSADNILSGDAGTEGLPAPESLVERFSYAFGYMFTKSYLQQGVEFSPEYFSQAMNDAVKGNECLYSDEELNAVFQEYQVKLTEQQKAAQAKVSAANMEEAVSFLAANKTREGVIETESGMQYEVVVEGDGERPTADDVVTVNYKGSFINGTVFESSYDSGKPVTFALNAVIPGWTEGLQLMPVGSKYRFYLHPDLAYKELGSAPKIGPNKLLIFEIELLSIDPDTAEEK